MDSNDSAFAVPDCKPTFLHVYEGLKAIIGLSGGLLNFVLVFVIISQKLLHSPCNFLIAASSFCIAHWQVNWMVSFVFVELDADVVSVPLCVGIQAYLIFCTQGMNVLILCIALDRLLNVALPTWARGLQKTSYFLAIITIAIVYVGLQTFDCVNSAYKSLKGIPIIESYSIVLFTSNLLFDKISRGAVFVILYRGSLLIGHRRSNYRDMIMCICFDFATPRVVLCMMIFNICSLVSYAVLWLLLKFKKNSKINKRIFKSLPIIMFVDGIGWGSITIIWNVVPGLKLGALVEYYISVFTWLVLLLATSSTSIVLLITSVRFITSFPEIETEKSFFPSVGCLFEGAFGIFRESHPIPPLKCNLALPPYIYRMRHGRSDTMLTCKDYRQAYIREFPTLFRCFARFKNKVNIISSTNNNVMVAGTNTESVWYTR